jgi:hypothetical protein
MTPGSRPASPFEAERGDRASPRTLALGLSKGEDER